MIGVSYFKVKELRLFHQIGRLTYILSICSKIGVNFFLVFLLLQAEEDACSESADAVDTLCETHSTESDKVECVNGGKYSFIPKQGPRSRGGGGVAGEARAP